MFTAPMGYLHLTTLRNSNILHGPIHSVGPRILNLAHDVHAVDDFAEDDVFAIQVWGLRRRDKELAAVCVGAGVGHGQKTGLVVLQFEVLIGEFVGAVDGAGAGAVAVDEVAALEHEVFDHTMELAPLVALRPPSVVLRLAGAELAEVLSSLGRHIFEQLHLDSA